MNDLPPVLIFGDHISAYGVIRGLAIFDIPIYIISKYNTGISIKSRYVKKSFILKPKDDLFIEKLNILYSNNFTKEVVLIVAGSDEYLEILAKSKSKLNSNMKTTFPDWEIVKKVRNKRLTYKVAEDLGIPTIPTYYITSFIELQNLLSVKKNSLSFPLFMKTEKSNSLFKKYGIKGIICNNIDELIENYKKYDGFEGQLLLQDLIPGENEKIKTTLITFNKKSEPTGFLINQKIRSSGKYLSGSLVGSTWSDKLLKHSLELLKEIGYYGYTSTQYKYDPRDGQYKLLEINGRISMSNSLAFKCGINLPYLMYTEALNRPLPNITDFKQEYPDNVLWWYPAGDLGHIIRCKAYLNPFKYFKDLVGGSSYIIEPMNWRDPYPGIVSISTGLLRRALRQF